MANKKIVQSVERYYTSKILEYGANPHGVDWNGLESQELRYSMVGSILEGHSIASVTDFGCGYGGFLNYLSRSGFSGKFVGLDVSVEMIQAAKKFCAGFRNCDFYVSDKVSEVTHFITASGVFNVKLDVMDGDWLSYITDTLDCFNRYSTKGFSFNCLTTYSDKELRRPDLYYADPLHLFDYCKRNFSRNVALLHDYGLYEFTILVRK